MWKQKVSNAQLSKVCRESSFTLSKVYCFKLWDYE